MRRYARLLSVVAIVSASFAGERALAHARLTTPFIPRSTNSGIVQGPCGTDPHTTPIPAQSGSTVTINWEETIHHSGKFEIYFSPANDANLSMGTVPGNNLLYQVNQTFTDNNVPHLYSAQITLPNVTCPDCTIQLVQVNTDNPASTVYYFSCADVALSPNPPPPPTPTPAPSPGPMPVCASHATFTAVNQTILQPLCVSCHTGAGAGGGYDLSTYAGVLRAVNTAAPTSSVIYTTTLDGAMPQNGSPLTSTQQNLLLLWIQGGALNN